MRRQIPATILTVAAAAALSACGAERAPTPDTATPQPPGGTVPVHLPAAGLRLEAPRSWARAPGPDPGILQLSSGRAIVALWRYPRSEPLPSTAKQLRQAETDLLAAVKARDPTFRRRALRRTRVDGKPALLLTGTATVAGVPRAVRSVHVYAHGAELVVDTLAEAAQLPRVVREVVEPLLRSLTWSAPR